MEEAKNFIEDTADLLILDELNIVLATGMLPLEEVIDFLKNIKVRQRSLQQDVVRLKN